MSVALITGILGQDGHYMARLLCEHGWRVVGLIRPSKEVRHPLDPPLPEAVQLVEWNMSEQAPLEELLKHHRPAHFYNFAAFASGAGMFDQPVEMADVNGLAVTRILEAIRMTNPRIRFCQASSSEMFGEPSASPQNEQTPFNPRSPYGAAKLYAHTMINIYRRRYDLFACSAILYNHESPYRGTGFVTRKIARAAASIKLGLAKELALGNLDARRDWGFAGDYVRAMWLMLNAAEPSDYVVATGTTHTVRELCEIAFGHVGLDYRDFVKEDAGAFRPVEQHELVGDPSSAARALGWSAQISFPELVRMLVDADLARLRLDKGLE